MGNRLATRGNPPLSPRWNVFARSDELDFVSGGCRFSPGCESQEFNKPIGTNRFPIGCRPRDPIQIASDHGPHCFSIPRIVFHVATSSTSIIRHRQSNFAYLRGHSRPIFPLSREINAKYKLICRAFDRYIKEWGGNDRIRFFSINQSVD